MSMTPLLDLMEGRSATVPDAPKDPRTILQDEAMGSILGARARGVRRQLVQVVTGGGKTRLAEKVALWSIRDLGKPALFLVNRRKLADQAANAFSSGGLRVGVEMADRRARRAEAILGGLDVVVGSKDTLQGTRLWDQWDAGYFGAILGDEAHWSRGERYKATIGRYDPDLLVGLTATPVPGLIPDVYDEQTFTCTVEDGVSRGVIVPFRAFEADAEVDLRDLNHRPKKGEYDVSEIAGRVASAASEIGSALAHAVSKVGGGRGIVFTPDVGSALLIARVLTKAGLPASAIHGSGDHHKMSEGLQKDILAMHRRGDVRALVSAELLVEGYDDPSIDWVANLRLTRKPSRFWQMVGRGLRLSDGKDVCFVYGIRCLTDNGTESSLDLFYADLEDPAARSRAVEDGRSRSRSGPIDPLSVRREAQEIADALARQEDSWEQHRQKVLDVAPVLAERTVRELGGLLDGRSPDMKKLGREIDRGSVPVSRPTAEALAALGFSAPDIRSVGPESGARAAASFWSDREACGMSTYKQVKKLTRSLKVPEPEALAMDSKSAGAAVGRAFTGGRFRRGRGA